MTITSYGEATYTYAKPDNLVDLCTITVNLTIQQRYTPPKPATLPQEMSRVLSDSWDSLKGLGRATLLTAVALIPWALPLGLVIFILVRMARRLRSRK